MFHAASLPNGVDGTCRSQSAPPLHSVLEQLSSEILVTAEITPQLEVGGQLQANESVPQDHATFN